MKTAAAIQSLLPFAALMSAACSGDAPATLLPISEAPGARAFIAIVSEPGFDPSVFAANIVDGLSLPLDASADASVELLFYRCALSGKGYETGPIAVADVGNSLPTSTINFRLRPNGQWEPFAQMSELARSVRTPVVDQTGCPTLRAVMQANAPRDFGWPVALEHGADFVELLGTNARITVSAAGVSEVSVATPGGIFSGGITASDGTVWVTTESGTLHYGTVESGFSSVPLTEQLFEARFAEHDGEIYAHSNRGFVRATPAAAEVIAADDFPITSCICSLAVAPDGQGGLLYSGQNEGELYRYDVATATVTKENLEDTEVLGPVTALHHHPLRGPILGSSLGFVARRSDEGWIDLEGPLGTDRVSTMTAFGSGLYVGKRFSLHYLRPDGQLCSQVAELRSTPRLLFTLDDGLLVYSLRDEVGLVDVFAATLCEEDP